MPAASTTQRGLTQALGAHVSDQTSLWSEIYDSLAWRLPKTDASPQHRLNRLAREHFPGLSQMLGEATCLAHRELLPLGAVSALKLWHKRANPAQLGGSVILFSHLGTLAVIDGNNRLNSHLASGSQEPVSAIVIAVRG